MNKYGTDGTETLKSWRTFVVLAFLATNFNILALSGKGDIDSMILFAISFSIASIIVLCVHFADIARGKDEWSSGK